MTEKLKEEAIEPKEYFDHLKGSLKCLDTELMEKNRATITGLIRKYKISGQKRALEKLKFNLEVILKEEELLKRGYDKYVYKEDVEKYIRDVSNNVVKIIELERFERDIPMEVIKRKIEVEDIFDDFLVVFTDYANQHKGRIRIEKDPILFGVFKDDEILEFHNKLYFVDDWIDEYCDLTFDKMIKEMSEKGHDIENEISCKDLNEKFLEIDNEIEEFIRKSEEEIKGKKEEKGILEKIKDFFKNL